MSTKTINISLPEDLLKKIDAVAKTEYSSRSDFIRDSLVRRLKHQRIVDEWGDDGEWETVVDFNEVKSGGVAATQVLEVIEKLLK